MAINRSKPGGTWMYSVYVPGSSYRLRGSTGTSDPAEARAVEALLKMAAGKNTTRDRLLRIIDALYPEDPAVTDDTPIEMVALDLDRAAAICGRDASKDCNARRQQNLAAIIDWTRKHWPAARTLRGIDRKCAQATAMRLGGWTRRETAARYDHNAHRAESEAAVGAAWVLLGTPNG